MKAFVVAFVDNALDEDFSVVDLVLRVLLVFAALVVRVEFFELDFSSDFVVRVCRTVVELAVNDTAAASLVVVELPVTTPELAFGANPTLTEGAN